MISPVEFVRAIRGKVDKETSRLAQVVSTTPLFVRFDGEARLQPIPRKSITPEPLRVGDRVMMARVGGKWVVSGRIQDGPARIWHMVEDSGYQSSDVSHTTTTADLSGYVRLRLTILGNASSGCAGEAFFIRVNGDSSSNYYWVRTALQANGTANATNFTGTGFHLGIITTTPRNAAVVDFLNLDTDFWTILGQTVRVNTGATSSVSVYGGRRTDSTTLESIQIGITGGCALANLRWTLEGVGV
jgi:hypothetical protein